MKALSICHTLISISFCTDIIHGKCKCKYIPFSIPACLVQVNNLKCSQNGGLRKIMARPKDSYQEWANTQIQICKYKYKKQYTKTNTNRECSQLQLAQNHGTFTRLMSRLKNVQRKQKAIIVKM